jgi:hypothetical protein
MHDVAAAGLTEPHRLLHAMSGGMHPNNVSTPNVPAESSADRNMSGYDTANMVGGTSVRTKGRGLLLPEGYGMHAIARHVIGCHLTECSRSAQRVLKRSF